MNVFWDIANQRLVRALTSKAAVAGYTCVLRDAVPVTLYLVAEQSNVTTPYAVTEIASGHSVKFGAKAALTDTAYLSEQATWTPSGSGATQCYLGSFPLNGASLVSAMAGLSALSLFAEFTTQDNDGKQYLSTQFSLKIIHDVIQGTETP